MATRAPARTTDMHEPGDENLLTPAEVAAQLDVVALGVQPHDDIADSPPGVQPAM
jgi:hypothetical protein